MAVGAGSPPNKMQRW